jgi:hypothetical protein
MIRAELTNEGSGRPPIASACGIVAKEGSPVLALCRMLLDAGHDPASPMTAIQTRRRLRSRARMGSCALCDADSNLDPLATPGARSRS